VLSYSIIVILLLILLTLLLLWYVVRIARKRAQAKPAAAAADSRQRSLTNLRWSFRSAVALIEANLASRWRRYRIPWILLLGEAGSGKSTLIESSGIDRAFKEASGSVQHVGVGWNYFNRGVVLDVGGEYLGDGSASSEHVWQTLLHLIERYRPQRPIDGVVLTISAAELIAAEGSSMEELAHKADVVHRRLWQAQSRFGVRFPVYVVITQCDRITGFSSFARVLPKHMREGMLGWSNPYDFDAGYQSDWAEQGIDGLVQSVFEAQAELLAAGREADDADAFVLFPSALAATRSALRAYLDQLFRPSAYHETFYFRGIYVSGDAGPLAKAESSLAAAGAPPQIDPGQRPPIPVGPGREPVFLRDLFERKVFAEFGLARASREALATRNRTVRILRWSTALLALLWLGSLALAWFRLTPKIVAYDNVLKEMVTVTTERRVSHANNIHLDNNWYLRHTLQLLTKMAPLGGVRLSWFSIPGSWPMISPLQGEIETVLYRGFNDIVVNLARKGLNEKLAALAGLPENPITSEIVGNPADCTAPSLGDPAQAAPLTLAIDQFPEFARLSEQVQKTETLGAQMEVFASLIGQGGGGMRDLRGLLHYTWNMNLSPSLDEGGYQSQVLRENKFTFKEGTPMHLLPPAATCAFNQQIAQLYTKFFTRNQALLLSQDIATRIAALSETSGNTVHGDEAYENLVIQINALDALLKSPSSRWLGSGKRDLGPAFDDLVHRVAAISSLGPDVAAHARATEQADIERLRKNLALPAAAAVGAILQRAPDGSWALAPDVASFGSALAMLLKQGFMAPAQGLRLEVNIDPGTVVRWNVKGLNDALTLANDQHRYLKDNLGKFPQLLQDDLHAIADRHLARLMTDLIANAESVGPEALQTGVSGSNPSVPANVSDFDRAGPQLVRLLAVLQEVGADSTYNDLTSLLKRDAVRGLFAINGALNSDGLYAVRDGNFSWWQGTKNPAAGAFRTADPQALADFLGQQFDQAAWLAKLSAPLLAIVDSAGLELDPDAAQVVSRLRGIAREVERYKTKNPNSSVAELESFIRTDMAQIDGQNCIAKLAPKLGAAPDADFFRQREIDLRQQLYARCVELATAASMKAYAVIRDSFAHTLAGRFPFSRQSNLAMGYAEADPEDVVHFLQLYDQEAKAVTFLLNGGAQQSGAVADVGTFLDQLAKVRTFLGPLLPLQDGAPAPGYDLAIQFRVNRRAEIDGNRILDWSLIAGDQTVDLRSTIRKLHWYVGMPITLTLRWAKDAPTQPVNDGTDPHMTLQGKDVVFGFTDPWSLVTMLETHAAGPTDVVSGAEVNPQTLKFEFPTQPIPAAGQYRSNVPGKRAKVFIRLTVMPGGKKNVLRLPVFPSYAPVASAQSASAPMSSGAQLEWPGARPGWPDAYGGMPLWVAPKSKPLAGRGSADARY
jgi:type VI secretion system protein ImpL